MRDITRFYAREVTWHARITEK